MQKISVGVLSKEGACSSLFFLKKRIRSSTWPIASPSRPIASLRLKILVFFSRKRRVSNSGVFRLRLRDHRGAGAEANSDESTSS